ncbi:MAG: leucine-rich repeat domain-containing protein [Treponema sp.]|nr:leucine-rich repeat domain-containing protein [Treponema sp.]
MVIPSTIEDYPVVEIRGQAFERSNVTSVVVHPGIKKIGQVAFANCPNLTTAILPDTLDKIERDTFHGCSSLHTVNLPAGLRVLGNSIFYNCGELYNLSIPDSITALTWDGGSQFRGCGKLKLTTRQRLKDLGYTGNF